MFYTATTNDTPNLKFYTQIVLFALKKVPIKPINTGFVGIYLFIQTLPEVFIDNS